MKRPVKPTRDLCALAAGLIGLVKITCLVGITGLTPNSLAESRLTTSPSHRNQCEEGHGDPTVAQMTDRHAYRCFIVMAISDKSSGARRRAVIVKS
jgi:hypothetical protein